jgi:hypothetical protein
LNAEVDRLDRKRIADATSPRDHGMVSYNALQYSSTNNAPDYTGNDDRERARAAAAQAQTDAHAHELKMQYAADELKNQAKINEAGLQGAALISQKQRDAHTENAAAQKAQLDNEYLQQTALQKMRDFQSQSGITDASKLVSVPTVDAHAGDAKRSLADATADADARAQLIALGAAQQKTAIAALAQLQREANEAGMRDDELANQKKLDAIDQYGEKVKGLYDAEVLMAKATAAINQRYDAERSLDLQKQVAAAEKALRDASAAGLTGQAKIDAEYRSHRADINASDAPMHVKAIELQTTDVTYSQQTAAQTKDDGDKAKAAAQKLQDDLQAINAEDLRYDQQAAEAERRIKEGGALGWVASYRNAVTEINQQEDERLAKVQQDNAKEIELAKGNTDALQRIYASTAQRRTDVEREAAAQIEQQQQQMAHQLSGMFESAFKDPVGTIKSLMEKLMFDLLAQWVLHFQMVKHLFGSAMQPGGAVGGGAAGSAGISGIIPNFAHGGGGIPAAAGAAYGASSSPDGASYRTPYLPAAGRVTGPGGIVMGAGSASSISGDLSGVRSLTGMLSPSNTTAAASIAAAAPANPYDVSQGPGWGLGGTDTGIGMPSGADSTVPNIANGLPGASGNTAGIGGGISPSPAAGGSGLAKAMGVLGAAGGAYMGEQTTVSAFEQGNAKGILSGTLGDAAAGAAIGTLFGQAGTAVGAAIGAGVGFVSGVIGAITDEGGRMAARDYYKQTLFPSLEADRLGQGGDPMSAVSDINRTAVQGMTYMSNKWGAQAAGWVKANYLDKEVLLALTDISQHATGGSQYTTRQAMQFDTGGYINGFGDMGTGSGHGLVNAQLGETVMHQQATATHAPVLNAMLDGASPSDIAAMYLKGSGSGPMATVAPSGGDQHIHVHAWDQSSVQKWLRGGGSRMIQKEQNNLAGQYAGDGVIG